MDVAYISVKYRQNKPWLPACSKHSQSPIESGSHYWWFSVQTHPQIVQIVQIVLLNKHTEMYMYLGLIGSVQIWNVSYLQLFLMTTRWDQPIEMTHWHNKNTKASTDPGTEDVSCVLVKPWDLCVSLLHYKTPALLSLTTYIWAPSNPYYYSCFHDYYYHYEEFISSLCWKLTTVESLV